MGLEGRVALVTGAWGIRSIGRAIALRLAREGADIVVSDLAPPPDRVPPEERRVGWKGVESVAEEVRGLGRRAASIECDITREAAVKALVARTVASMGGVDVLVNSARAFLASQPTLMDISAGEWAWLMAVNLRGPIVTSRCAAQAMIERTRGGSIVNISSIGGVRPMDDVWAAYGVSKSGLNMATRMLALELAPHGIRVNAVCPGFIHTSRVMPDEARRAQEQSIELREYRASMLEERARTIPAGRPGRPEDIAEAVCFLASDTASYVTGQCLNVDGGIVMD